MVTLHLRENIKRNYTNLDNKSKKQIKQQRFTGTGWAKTIIKLMLETNVTKWKHRCNLHFQAKNSHHNNEFVSFRKRALLIIVDHVSTKTESLTV